VPAERAEGAMIALSFASKGTTAGELRRRKCRRPRDGVAPPMAAVRVVFCPAVAGLAELASSAMVASLRTVMVVAFEVEAA